MNVGLLVESDGKFSVRHARKLDKVRAISAALDPSDLLNELNHVVASVKDCSFDDVAQRVAASSFLECNFKGTFTPGSNVLAEHYISDLMVRYVDAEVAPPKPVRKRPTKLRQEIAKLFRSEKILAKPSEGLDSHRILYRHSLAEGVEADFVLKNGAYHVVESVDASSTEVSLQRSLYEIAMSTLTFEHARIGFGNNSVRPKLVYQAPADLERALAPSLYAVEHQGAELINWASEENKVQFLEKFANLAISSEPKRNAPTLFNASALPPTKLN
ncbi:hypothetical protein [Qipengyuania atrilutea]|uniref:Uncharacterized protein n=1 Tax=Qipengyuania atrilutea TaxID=2744473 RepID=A0A850HCS6_9SPHN|nr:hypothetical protein [Actirhodobacter atriluteus]NVD44909.1 hypothetical protein [Actirhodobacter atriluteus]